MSRREERDRAISERRNEWFCPPHEFTPCSEALIVCQHERCQFYKHEHPSPFIGEPKNWHSDAKWPTLLREMPWPELTRFRDLQNNGWMCLPHWDRPEENSVGEDISDAVCEAWLKWNSRSGSEAR